MQTFIFFWNDVWSESAGDFIPPPPPPHPPWFHGFPKTPDKAYKLAKKPLPKKSMDKNVTQEFSAMP